MSMDAMSMTVILPAPGAELVERMKRTRLADVPRELYRFLMATLRAFMAGSEKVATSAEALPVVDDVPFSDTEDRPEQPQIYPQASATGRWRVRYRRTGRGLAAHEEWAGSMLVKDAGIRTRIVVAETPVDAWVIVVSTVAEVSKEFAYHCMEIEEVR